MNIDDLILTLLTICYEKDTKYNQCMRWIGTGIHLLKYIFLKLFIQACWQFIDLSLCILQIFIALFTVIHFRIEDKKFYLLLELKPISWFTSVQCKHDIANQYTYTFFNKFTVCNWNVKFAAIHLMVIMQNKSVIWFLEKKRKYMHMHVLQR